MLNSRRLPSSPWENNTEERTLYHNQYDQAVNTDERFCLIPDYYKTAPLQPDDAEISPAMQDFSPGIEPHQMLPLSPSRSSAYKTQDGRATVFGQSPDCFTQSGSRRTDDGHIFYTKNCNSRHPEQPALEDSYSYNGQQMSRNHQANYKENWRPSNYYSERQPYQMQGQGSQEEQCRDRYHLTPMFTPEIPTFTGKIDDWDAFWLQFTIWSETLELNKREFGTQLLLSLKGSALSFVTTLDPDTVRDTDLLINALRRRFGHHAPSQTYRAMLTSLHKTSKESTQDYAARVQMMMSRAYPDIKMTNTFQQLSIEHFLNGLPEQEISYEVMKLNPKTLEEAVDKFMWLESCKLITGRMTCTTRKHKRKDSSSDASKFEDSDIRRVKRKKYMTEEGLNQLHLETHDRIEDHDELQCQHLCYTSDEEDDISQQYINWRHPMQQDLNTRGLSLSAKSQPQA